jgi:Na+/H+-dicarboxylate symporter
VSSGSRILAGLALGVATGLFLGELAGPLGIVADGFVRLLQMTVLPYVTVSLIVEIGSLDPATARRLFLPIPVGEARLYRSSLIHLPNRS